MTTKVTQPTAESKAKIYSNDKKIWVGMTVKDAAKSTKLMEIFNYADYDKNGSIDKSELDRYNGPIFIHNFETSDTRVFGVYNGKTAIFDSYGVIKGKLIKNNEIDYFPGLTIEKVNEKGRKIFTLIDSNHDGVISKKELTKILNIKTKEEQTLKAIKMLANKQINNKMTAYELGWGASILGGIGIAAKECSIGGAIAIGGTLGAVVGMGVAILAGGGYLAYEHFFNNRKEQAEQLVDAFEKEFGSNPFVRENNIIGNLRQAISKQFNIWNGRQDL